MVREYVELFGPCEVGEVTFTKVMITSWSGFKYQLAESTSRVLNASSALRRP
jgi:hypothetical protein